jgi:hypothetical protein
LDAFAYKK